MCPAVRINLSEAPRCLLQRAICLNWTPNCTRLQLCAEASYRQWSAQWTGCAISWEVVMPTIQKALRSTRAKDLATRRIHIERELCLEALHFFTLSVTSLFMWENSLSSSWGSRRGRTPQQRQLPVCSSRVRSVAEAGCQVFSRVGGISASQEVSYCTSRQTAPLCWRVWRPLEPSTEPAGCSLSWRIRNNMSNRENVSKKHETS